MLMCAVFREVRSGSGKLVWCVIWMYYGRCFLNRSPCVLDLKFHLDVAPFLQIHRHQKAVVLFLVRDNLRLFGDCGKLQYDDVYSNYTYCSMTQRMKRLDALKESL